jgi:hypothetical protein
MITDDVLFNLYIIMYMYWQACESLPLLLMYVINVFLNTNKG